MRRLNFLLTAVLTYSAAVSAVGQITERQRPAEWANLVRGGRFMDRFEAMPDGNLRADVWGADSVRPRFVDNGIERPDLSFWGGNIVRGDDGRYHLFVCGWPERSEKGHMTWPASTVYHTTSSRPWGPYTIADTIGKGHNPEVYRTDDGRYVLYVIDGRYVAPRLSGPWTYGKFDFDTRDRRVIEGLSNLTFARRSDGSFLMVCRGGGVWVSRDGVAPYRQITERRIYPAVAGEFEDPVVWRDSLQYHLIVNDWLGRIAYYQRSLDGVHWLTEPGEAYAPGVSFHRDGRVEHWFKYERAKVLQDAQGRVEQINFAVIDTIKWNDLGGDRHSSKNICLPMNKGLLLEVLNRKPITDKTRTVRLRIRAEKDFHPITDVDVASVRFGCYTEVNYGRGARALSAEADGEDLILTFDAAACAITPEEFAPKLIGADRRGRLLFGYARLPYVDYRPPILSSLAPRYESASQSVSLTVENFGLSTSAKTRVAIEQGGRTVATATVSRLKPYASTTLTLPLDGTAWDTAAPHRVVFSRNGRTVGETEFPGTPTP